MPKVKGGKGKSQVSRLYRKVDHLTGILKNEARMGSYSKAAKAAVSIFSGGANRDAYHKQFGIQFDVFGQAFCILNNSSVQGISGYTTGARPQTVSDLCLNGVGYVPQQVVPLSAPPGFQQVEAQQYQFTWAVMVIPNGIPVDEVLQNLNPPLFTPSATVGPQLNVIEQFVSPGAGFEYIQGAVSMNQKAINTVPTLQRGLINNNKLLNANLTRLDPIPGLNDLGAAAADPVVAELVLPRFEVAMSGVGVCIFNSGSVSNHLIQAYNPEKIRTKVDDVIVFMAKAGPGQTVGIQALISYKTHF